MEREISEVKICSKSHRKCTWRRRKALLLMEGKGDMSEQWGVSEMTLCKKYGTPPLLGLFLKRKKWYTTI